MGGWWCKWVVSAWAGVLLMQPPLLVVFLFVSNGLFVESNERERLEML